MAGGLGRELLSEYRATEQIEARHFLTIRFDKDEITEHC